jgi:uncharacterized LabA/DUF88 family protein
MERVAVFVDAGYLFAQGSAALTGSKQPRELLALDPTIARDALASYAANKAPKASLLRIYWYDGARGNGRPTTDQAQLAHLDDIKLRLGFVNSRGEQKGVDSLIVTDLIELARLKSIDEAVLLSGDEDVRVGVQIAQSYGVRLHLLGITPSRGSQSPQLMQEADTTGEWDKAAISAFLSVRELPKVVTAPHVLPALPVLTPPVLPVIAELTEHQLKTATASFVASLTGADLEGVQAYWKDARGVPPDLDKRLLGRCRDVAGGRSLERDELKLIRSEFQRLVRAKISSA